jgi:hypothetical protein
MSLPPPALARTATTVPGALEKDTGLRYHSSRRAANFQWRVKKAEVHAKEKKLISQHIFYDYRAQRRRSQKGLWAATKEGPTYLPQPKAVGSTTSEQTCGERVYTPPPTI